MAEQTALRVRGIGLVAQGAVAGSFLTRLPAFLNRLELVMNPRVQVSTRAANALRAGKAVHRYEALAGAKSIWVFAKPALLDKTMQDLAQSVSLSNRAVVVCGTWRDSLSFAALNTAEAQVATLCEMPESNERTFVAEGHAAAVKDIAQILAADRKKLIELKAGTKPLFVSGVHLSAHMLLPWAGTSLESFRFAGLTRTEASLAMQAIAGAAMRSYIRGGEKALPRAEAQEMQQLLDDTREAIRALNPRLGEFFDAAPGKWLDFVGGKRFWEAPLKSLHARPNGG